MNMLIYCENGNLTIRKPNGLEYTFENTDKQLITCFQANTPSLFLVLSDYHFTMDHVSSSFRNAWPH